MVVRVEGGEGGELIAEGVLGGVQRPLGGAGDDEVVDGDVEDFGDADDGFEAGGDFAAFVAADLPGVAVDLGGEFGLGPAVFGAQLAEALGGCVNPSWPRRDGFIRPRRESGPGMIPECQSPARS